jgi:hypothetical protein
MPSDPAARRRQLLTAVSVLGVSLGMAAPAAARDPTAVENPIGVQTSQKGAQVSIKGDQNSYKENVQNSYKENVQNSHKDNVQNSQKGVPAGITGGAAGAPAP